MLLGKQRHSVRERGEDSESSVLHINTTCIVDTGFSIWYYLICSCVILYTYMTMLCNNLSELYGMGTNTAVSHVKKKLLSSPLPAVLQYIPVCQKHGTT